MPANEKPKLETGHRMLLLLECFTDLRPEWGVTELSEELDCYKSVIHRMLTTLEARGYVTQNPVTKKYRLGLKLFELGMVVARGMNLRTLARPVLETLAERTGETVLLTIVDGQSGVCIEKMESHESIKSTSQLGKRVPLYGGAPTKLLMAYLPEYEREGIIAGGLNAFSPFTDTDPDTLRESLAKIRAQGYSWTFQEVDMGSVGIAFPVRDHEEKVVASIAILGPEFRMEGKMERCHEACGEAAQAISRGLGSQWRYEARTAGI
ncbi:IclR family transcriptional regulator [Paenibacillus tepidiphilus]|uniref:IclR family transcriptional regulator n=1 Tax=Paenibacillus tepidiphilus TaxID=2608683 RepID=UPI001239D974|nr:IclR family transcriptional regulator [Paenibacillus tepidiphilus]